MKKHLLTRPGDWKFDQDTSQVFDAHVKKSIPCYQEIQAMISLIAQKHLGTSSRVYDLGTGTGAVIQSIFEANPDKQVEYIGMDSSAAMLAQAKNKCAGIPNCQFVHAPLEDFSLKPADLICSVFTLQFIPVAKRGFILQKIKNALKEHGLFLWCEKVTQSDPFSEQLLRTVHENWKLQYFTPAEVSAKKMSLQKVMLPLSLSENHQLLRDNGFTYCQSFFQWGNFVGILAR